MPTLGIKNFFLTVACIRCMRASACLCVVACSKVFFYPIPLRPSLCRCRRVRGPLRPALPPLHPATGGGLREGRPGGPPPVPVRERHHPEPRHPAGDPGVRERGRPGGAEHHHRAQHRRVRQAAPQGAPRRPPPHRRRRPGAPRQGLPQERVEQRAGHRMPCPLSAWACLLGVRTPEPEPLHACPFRGSMERIFLWCHTRTCAIAHAVREIVMLLPLHRYPPLPVAGGHQEGLAWAPGAHRVDREPRRGGRREPAGPLVGEGEEAPAVPPQEPAEPGDAHGAGVDPAGDAEPARGDGERPGRHCGRRPGAVGGVRLVPGEREAGPNDRCAPWRVPLRSRRPSPAPLAALALPSTATVRGDVPPPPLLPVCPPGPVPQSAAGRSATGSGAACRPRRCR